MELKHLRHFIAAAELGNIGMAARRLNISQPPVTRTIHALEHELGFSLFDRTPRGVVLTEAGAQFLADARRVIAAAELAKTRAREVSQGTLGRLNVGFFGSVINSHVPRILRRFCDDHPDVEIDLERMPQGDQIKAILEGRTHIGFGRYYPPHDGIETRMLARESLQVVVRNDSELSRRTSLTPADIAMYPVILFPSAERPSFADQVLAAFEDLGITLKVTEFVTDNATALARVNCSKVISVIPDSAVQHHHETLAFLPLSEISLKIPARCAFVSSAHKKSPLLRRLLPYLEA